MQATTTSVLQIRPDGTVDSVNVTMAHPVFRDYVEGALKQWKFGPTGKAFTQEITVRFSLSGCDDVHSIDADAYRETHVQATLPELVEVSTCLEPIVTHVN